MKIPSIRDIARVVDLSAVRADSDEREIQTLIELARRYCPVAVFSLPSYTERVRDLLSDRPNIIVGGVVGFPSGGHTSQAKAREAEELISLGCGELDMVLNVGWLRSGREHDVLKDIRSVVSAAQGRPVKVIIECGYLSSQQVIAASLLCVDGGAAFVKTGTGWGQKDTTVEDIRTIRSAIGDTIGIKAAGGVRDLATLRAMQKAGATRFGIGVRTAQSIFNECDRDHSDGGHDLPE